ncbi:MAG: SPOR domain-containing protein [Lewinellaceae bacterium]|nr:SPOR domain-containing protein [Phaeodactylibacter sp.]MCB0615264.1 SPOR domain-containing protein [Phaeodactylibacter sp.]MCB9346721.1 SPOR domain-containing protein [Lewinellaceae bacterium]
MSRLDYVTIAIVAVCVAALVYLIYMTTNLMGDSGEPGTTTETTTPSTNTEGQEDDTYYFNDEGQANSDNQTDVGVAKSDDYSNYDYQNGESLDKGRSPASNSSTTATPNELDTKGSGVAEEGYSNTSTSNRINSSNTAASSGRYMVMAGTFSVKAYAQDMEKKLRGLGYNNVVLEPFDRGKFTVVMVDRFDSISEAKALVSELKGKGVESYVKRK